MVKTRKIFIPCSKLSQPNGILDSYILWIWGSKSQDFFWDLAEIRMAHNNPLLNLTEAASGKLNLDEKIVMKGVLDVNTVRFNSIILSFLS